MALRKAALDRSVFGKHNDFSDAVAEKAPETSGVQVLSSSSDSVNPRTSEIPPKRCALPAALAP
jgi:hypothetical protein